MRTFDDAVSPDRYTLTITEPDSNGHIGFIITRTVGEKEEKVTFLADATTYPDIVRYINTLTWTLHG